MTTPAAEPFRGAFTPVTEEVTAFDLSVTGTLPPELTGRYVRNGPNPLVPDDPRNHLFLGEGMVHGVRLRDGRAEWYRNRWVRSAGVSKVLGERRRRGAAVARADISPNTHVIGHAGRTFALIESGFRPYELTEELDTLGPCDFQGSLPAGFTAHPKLDPVTGELHAVAHATRFAFVQHLVVSPDGLVKRIVNIPAPHRPVMHDFGLTERYVVLYDLPVVNSLAAAAAREQSVYSWEEGRSARVGLLPRGGTEVRWFEIEPCWVFHTLNAYDDGDRVVIDVVRYPRMFGDLRLDGNSLPTLDRWVVDTVSGKVTETRIDDRPQEFPNVNPALVGAPHRYGYAATVPDMHDYFGPYAGPAGHGAADLERGPVAGHALIKHDFAHGTAQVREFGAGHYTGEPVFVPSAAADGEDDGWLLAYVHDPVRGASDLVVLSAQDVTGEPVATVHLPVRVPLGFHGSWIPDPS
ncbi:carotenoid oxygenase family protein [Streptacidiphilus anmyonensis]|uniref:carotenoid oxygenase family protein n=1 Tax=Streptacidiphilus anmyonensis TaxID=405782 RepID=UPI0005A5D5D9|nr:carotenoid oxygenase family protein [Streptacidiphilus anmyonensis]